MARILLLEDDPLFSAMMKAMLERAGHIVRAANSGRTALELLGSEPVDVLVTDIFMPDTDGIETIRAVMQQSPNVRIIAMSGGGSHGGYDFLAAARRLGADEVLAKPFRQGDLFAALDRCLERSATFEQGAAKPDQASRR